MVPTPDGLWHRILITGEFYRGGTQDTDLNQGKIGRDFAIFSRISLACFLCFSCLFLIRGPGVSPPPMGFGIGILITGGNLWGGGYAS